MELEFDRTQLTGYNVVLDTVVFQEETLETIVPDACPDILRLVDTQGTVLLKSKAAADGRAALTGTARLTVLYLPEGGGSLCGMEVNIPFSVNVEGKGIRGGCAVMAVLRVAGTDARAVNPRKILARVEIAAEVKAFEESVLSLCAGVRAADGTVEQRTESCRMYRVCALQEKQAAFEDDLTVPAGRPAAEELLSSRVRLGCGETKIIGNKLIFKGEAQVRLLYRPVGGGVDAADFMLPFSQIMEVADVGEDAVCDMEVSLLGADFVLGEDGRTVSAALSMLAQAAVSESRTVTLLTDAYSTGCALRVERAIVDYEQCGARATGRQNLREVIETGLAVRTVADCSCMVGRTEQSRQAGELRLSAEVVVTALCVTEDGECCAVSRSFEVGCAVDVEEDCSCRFRCRCEVPTATPTADGVEVRAVLEFPYLVLKNGQAFVISDAGEAEDAGETSGPRPSIALRVLQDGECLWDVAKRYRTTIGDIVRANELESEQPVPGTLLLIPVKR